MVQYSIPPLTWFLSDLHLFDPWASRLRRFGVGAEDILKHNDALARSWDRHIAPQDSVWVLGDVTCEIDVTRSIDWLRERPGRKRLILGNWDDEHREKYLRSGVFDLVTDRWRFHAERVTERGGEKVVETVELTLSHYPQKGNVYGHTHRFVKVDERYPGKVHVGWEGWHKPVELSEILELMEGQT